MVTFTLDAVISAVESKGGIGKKSGAEWKAATGIALMGSQIVRFSVFFNERSAELFKQVSALKSGVKVRMTCTGLEQRNGVADCNISACEVLK